MKKIFTVFAFITLSLFASAQDDVLIPNGSFESWTGGLPDGWDLVAGRAREYTSISMTINSVSGVLTANNGTKYLGILNDSPAVDGKITLGRIQTKFAMSRKPADFRYKFNYIGATTNETFTIFVFGFINQFGNPDTVLRKGFFVNPAGSKVATPVGSVIPWIGVRHLLAPTDYTDNITPDSFAVMFSPSGAFTSTPTTSLSTMLLIDNITFSNYATGTADEIKSTMHQALYNYPNPADNYTNIEFELPLKSDFTFSVYDLNGKLIYSNEYKQQEQGSHTINYNTTELANGLYFYRVDSDYLKEGGKLLIKR